MQRTIYTGLVLASVLVLAGCSGRPQSFDTLAAAGNIVPVGIWSDGTTMWVADNGSDGASGKIYAYDLATKARDASKDFDTLIDAKNISPFGIWSDGTTMWVISGAKIYAYNLATKVRDAGKDFDTLAAAGNIYPTGIWSDGTTMWVANYDVDNESNAKIYAYNLATKRPIP